MPKILVVDDIRDGIDLYLDWLKSRGYTAIGALNVEEALAQIEDTKDITLVITDLAMPKKDGYELINRLGEADYKIPILVVSGTEFDKSNVKYNGTIDYIQKSATTFEDLNSKIKNLVD